MPKNLDSKNKSPEELTRLLKENRAKLIRLKFELNENKLKDVSQIGKTRKEIARIMTFLKQQNKNS